MVMFLKGFIDIDLNYKYLQVINRFKILPNMLITYKYLLAIIVTYNYLPNIYSYILTITPFDFKKLYYNKIIYNFLYVYILLRRINK